MIDSSRSTLWSQLVQWGSALALLAIMGGCGSSGSSTSPSWKTNTGYVLQPRFEEGSSYAVETTMDQTMNMVVMGRSLEVDQQQSMVHRYDVRDRAADGTITLDYTTTRVRGETSMPAMGRSMSYDSEDTTASGQAGRMSRRMRSMTGHTISARLSPQGSVRAVTGVEALLDSLAAVEQDSTQAQVLRRMMGPDAVRQQLNLSFGVYPDRPVSVGDTWTDESAVRLGVPMQIKATYTLDSIRSTQAVIDARMDLSPVEGDSTIQMGGHVDEDEPHGRHGGENSSRCAQWAPLRKHPAHGNVRNGDGGTGAGNTRVVDGDGVEIRGNDREKDPGTREGAIILRRRGQVEEDRAGDYPDQASASLLRPVTGCREDSLNSTSGPLDSFLRMRSSWRALAPVIFVRALAFCG